MFIIIKVNLIACKGYCYSDASACMSALGLLCQTFAVSDIVWPLWPLIMMPVLIDSHAMMYLLLHSYLVSIEDYKMEIVASIVPLEYAWSILNILLHN